jgi:hypothetical protein
MRSNQCKLRTIDRIVNLIWDFDDRELRTNWAQRSYWLLHQHALALIRLHLNKETAKEAYELIKRFFVVYTWIVLYVSNKKFFVRAYGHRCWLSLYHRKLAHKLKEGDKPRAIQLYATVDNRRIDKEFIAYMSEWAVSSEKDSKTWLQMHREPPNYRRGGYLNKARLAAVVEKLQTA